jgi:hypothetical protein
MRAKKWMGTKPRKCDLCHEQIEDTFIDGVTMYGPWGIMCPSCHKVKGKGLGTGRGQKYNLDETGEYIKVEG